VYTRSHEDAAAASGLAYLATALARVALARASLARVALAPVALAPVALAVARKKKDRSGWVHAAHEERDGHRR